MKTPTSNLLESLRAPTREEEAEHYRTGIEKNCLVCDRSLTITWTDYNGQGRCMTCGATYQVLGSHLREDYLEEIGLTKDAVAKRYSDMFSTVPLARAYWLEVGKALPFGTYLGGGPITDDEYESFYRWLDQNADLIKDQYQDDFNWDAIHAHVTGSEARS